MSLFRDEVFGSKTESELLSRLKGYPLNELTVKELQSIGTSLGVSGMTQVKKPVLIDKISIALIAKIGVPGGVVPEYVYMVFDTETTLIENNVPGRLLQLGYQIYRGTKLLLQEEFYVYPDGFDLESPELGTDIHGITPFTLRNKGEKSSIILNMWLNRIDEWKVDILVSHNFPFDWLVMQQELALLGRGKALNGKDIRTICTCRSSPILTYVQVKNQKPRATFPKLSELYKSLFGVEPVVEHHALADVKLTSRSLFRLIELGVLDVEKDSKPIIEVPEY